MRQTWRNTSANSSLDTEHEYDSVMNEGQNNTNAEDRVFLSAESASKKILRCSAFWCKEIHKERIEELMNLLSPLEFLEDI